MDTPFRWGILENGAKGQADYIDHELIVQVGSVEYSTDDDEGKTEPIADATNVGPAILLHLHATMSCPQQQ